MKRLLIVAIIGVTIFLWVWNCSKDMVKVRGGDFIPPFVNEDEPKVILVRDFEMDKTLVTEGDFLKFVEANPIWRKSKIPAIYHDGNYLSHWPTDLKNNGETKSQKRPVTRVSWYAARAHCEWRGKRLPLELEWEYAAQEDDANKLEWYSQATGDSMGTVRSQKPNKKGIYDFHSLVWEWVDDFNASILLSASRQEGDVESKLVCGNSGTATNRKDYAAFLRYAFRSSLKANYTSQILGFRCAR